MLKYKDTQTRPSSLYVFIAIIPKQIMVSNCISICFIHFLIIAYSILYLFHIYHGSITSTANLTSNIAEQTSSGDIILQWSIQKQLQIVCNRLRIPEPTYTLHEAIVDHGIQYMLDIMHVLLLPWSLHNLVALVDLQLLITTRKKTLLCFYCVAYWVQPEGGYAISTIRMFNKLKHNWRILCTKTSSCVSRLQH
jgi:hypothetical protein